MADFRQDQYNQCSNYQILCCLLIGILVVGTNRLWKQRAMHRIGAETS